MVKKLLNMRSRFKKVTHSVKRLLSREHNTIDKERVSLLLFCYIPIMLIGIAANFLGITEPSASFFNYTHSLCLITAVLFFYLFCKRRISVSTCLAAFTIIGEAVISIEMIYCALHASPYYNFLIMANTVLLALNVMVSVSAYMKKNTIVLGCATVFIYIVCSYLAEDAILKSFIMVFLIAFCFVCFAGFLVATSANKLERDNEKFRRDEIELLHILRLKRDEVMTYLSLASKKYDYDGMKVLFERLDAKSRRNLLTNVDAYMRTRDTDLEIMEKVFPEFTPSEKEIGRLVLQGKKLSEICLLLGKNESNINSQRANMRRKLGLRPTDHLQKQMQARLDRFSDALKPEQ